MSFLLGIPIFSGELPVREGRFVVILFDSLVLFRQVEGDSHDDFAERSGWVDMLPLKKIPWMIYLEWMEFFFNGYI